MGLSDLLAFAVVALGMVLTPGPNMVYLYRDQFPKAERLG